MLKNCVNCRVFKISKKEISNSEHFHNSVKNGLNS